MPSPTSALSTLRPDLAESFMEYELDMNQRGFIGNQVFPVVSVASQAGNFGKIPLEQLLQSPDTLRAPGSGYSRGDFTFESATYACIEHGYEEPVDDREAKMYAQYFNAEMISTMRAYSAVLLAQEIRVAAAVFNTGTWTGAALTTAVGTEWSTAATATPIVNVNAAAKLVWDGSGLWPNALIINERVLKNIRVCAEVQDSIASSGAGASFQQGDISLQQIAEAFDLQHVIVSGSAKNTGNKGAAATIAPVWSDEYAMVARIATGPDFREPCIGRSFHWAEDGSSEGGTVESYRDESKRSDIIRVRQDMDEVTLYAQAGHLLSNITA